jgi:hypothetical protein
VRANPMTEPGKAPTTLYRNRLGRTTSVTSSAVLHVATDAPRLHHVWSGHDGSDFVPVGEKAREPFVLRV